MVNAGNTFSSDRLSFTQAQYEATINWDFAGENGKSPSNPSLPSVGYPCGVPNGYGWKFGMSSEEAVLIARKVP
ncbi:MAG: hypothetical protein ACYT04_94590, partial [Nostoc sp.]